MACLRYQHPVCPAEQHLAAEAGHLRHNVAHQVLGLQVVLHQAKHAQHLGHTQLVVLGQRQQQLRGVPDSTNREG